MPPKAGFTAYMREYRAAGRDEHSKIVNSRAYRLERKKHLATFAAGGSCCADCGWAPVDDAEWDALDFHHRDPVQKKFGVSGAGARALLSARAEAAKCDLLCARCHRIRHARMSVSGKGTSKGRPRKTLAVS